MFLPMVVAGNEGSWGGRGIVKKQVKRGTAL